MISNRYKILSNMHKTINVRFPHHLSLFKKTPDKCHRRIVSLNEYREKIERIKMDFNSISIKSSAIFKRNLAGKVENHKQTSTSMNPCVKVLEEIDNYI